MPKLKPLSNDTPTDPASRIQANLILAKSIHALSRLLILTQGIEPSDDSQKRRLSQITKKARRALARNELLQQQQASPPSLELNIASLDRLINSTGPQIPSLSTQQQQQQQQSNHNHSTSGKREKKRARDAALAFLDDVDQDGLLRQSLRGGARGSDELLS